MKRCQLVRYFISALAAWDFLRGSTHTPHRPGLRASIFQASGAEVVPCMAREGLVQGSTVRLPSRPGQAGLHEARLLLLCPWLLGSGMWGAGPGSELASLPLKGLPVSLAARLQPGMMPAGVAGAGPGFSDPQPLGNLRDSVAGKGSSAGEPVGAARRRGYSGLLVCLLWARPSVPVPGQSRVP